LHEWSENLKKIGMLGCLLVFIAFEMWLLEQWSTQPQVQNIEDPFLYYIQLNEQIFSEMKCFPVAKDVDLDQYPVTYENSWRAKRSYGGDRQHEGCDLMAVVNERGKYKICSMTDGTVKNIGWLEQGGWRIGILSDSGIYYYYAHLDSYEKAFEIGEKIAAGQILGRMGDSGYGKEPDTKGKFDVHLHVGIYAEDEQGNEKALNPYWYLKQLEI
jgi:murein DD-endopeptidase MepM/ murein hydrolase activator NlpD